MQSQVENVKVCVKIGDDNGIRLLPKMLRNIYYLQGVVAMHGPNEEALDEHLSLVYLLLDKPQDIGKSVREFNKKMKEIVEPKGIRFKISPKHKKELEGLVPDEKFRQEILDIADLHCREEMENFRIDSFNIHKEHNIVAIQFYGRINKRMCLQIWADNGKITKHEAFDLGPEDNEPAADPNLPAPTTP